MTQHTKESLMALLVEHESKAIASDQWPKALLKSRAEFSTALDEVFASLTPVSDEPVWGTKSYMEDGNLVTVNLRRSDVYADSHPAPLRELSNTGIAAALGEMG